MPDPDQLYATMGVMAGNCIEGDPVWLMLVGPASSGKTTMLECLTELDGVRVTGKIKTEASLLSGVGKKDRDDDATGGLLREIGEAGALVFMDFTSILSIPKDQLLSLLGAFREIYDGRYGREIGADGGKKLHWKGHAALLGGCTPVIDRHATVIGEMGDRAIFFRYPLSDGYREGLTSLNDESKAESKILRARLVRETFDQCGLALQRKTARRELTLQERNRIMLLAQFGGKARTSVPRDFKREIDDIPVSEVPVRLGNELAQFFLGAEKLGLAEEDRWRIVKRLAVDCMPLLRRMVLDSVMLLSADGQAHSPAVAARVPTSTAAVERALEDLALLGIIGRRDGGQWELTEWAGERLAGRAETEEE
jgi:hypothetical protein